MCSSGLTVAVPSSYIDHHDFTGGIVRILGSWINIQELCVSAILLILNPLEDIFSQHIFQDNVLPLKSVCLRL